MSIIFFLNPLELQGVPFHPLGDNLPLKDSTVTVPGYIEPPATNGFPFQYWALGQYIPQPGDHFNLYYNYTLAILDVLFWIVILSTLIFGLDAVLGRVKHRADRDTKR